MHPIKPRPLNDLPDEHLLEALHALARRSTAVEAELLVHIAEVDARRLYLRKACPSMHAYCMCVLGMDEGPAFRRIRAARAARDYPAILEWLGSGRLHLAGIALLVPHMTPENHRSLLVEASGRSKREIEELVAARFPKPDAKSYVRPVASSESSAAEGNLFESGSSAEGASTAAGTSETPPAPREAEEAPGVTGVPTDASGTAMETKNPAATPVPSPAARPKVPPAVRVEPLSADRYRIQFTADRAFRDKLHRLQSLARHRIPDGDLESVFDLAFTLALETMEKRRFALLANVVPPKRTAKENGPHDVPPPPNTAESSEMESTDGTSGTSATPSRSGRRTTNTKKPRSRHIPNAIKREVYTRDEGRCTFVEPEGRRCPEKVDVEFHHRIPYGRGGAHVAENITLRCRPHNAYQARLDFGEDAVAARIRERRDRPRKSAARVDEGNSPGASRPSPARTCRHVTNHEPRGEWPSCVIRAYARFWETTKSGR